MSKGTIVQGDICRSRLLSKDFFYPRRLLSIDSNNTLLLQVSGNFEDQSQVLGNFEEGGGKSLTRTEPPKHIDQDQTLQIMSTNYIDQASM